ncbi:hypothetical protein WA158_006226 [Blastocystis sp. Blastoise]
MMFFLAQYIELTFSEGGRSYTGINNRDNQNRLQSISTRVSDIRLPSHEYEITLVDQIGLDQSNAIIHLVQRWNGPMIITIALNKTDSFRKVLETYSTYSRNLRLLSYTMISKETFTMNRLRNMAISAVTTSHFLAIDSIAIPSSELYSQLLQVSPTVFRMKNRIIAIPSFYLEHDAYSNQIGKTYSFEDYIKQILPYIPKTKEELFKCVKEGNCHKPNSNDDSQNYIPQMWYSNNEKWTIIPFLNNNKQQQPYFVQQKLEITPLYDENVYSTQISRLSYVLKLKCLNYIPTLFYGGFFIQIPSMKYIYYLLSDYIPDYMSPETKTVLKRQINKSLKRIAEEYEIQLDNICLEGFKLKDFSRYLPPAENDQ